MNQRWRSQGSEALSIEGSIDLVTTIERGIVSGKMSKEFFYSAFSAMKGLKIMVSDGNGRRIDSTYNDVQLVIQAWTNQAFYLKLSDLKGESAFNNA